MTVFKWLGFALGLLVLAVWLAGQLGLLSGSMPTDLGVKEGRLKQPSKTPNSVSSQAALWPDHPQREYAGIAALALRGGDGAATLARLQQLVAAYPGAKLIRSQDGYFYAQFTTRWLKFTDDAEFWLDPAAGVIEVRSASRLGSKDQGVNRERIEALRSQLAQ